MKTRHPWLRHAAALITATVASLACLVPAFADEGMWTYDNFPAARVKELYGADITPQWLDRVRQATIRLSNCTASFVSPDGLILTNHHCAAGCLAELSGPGNDRLQNGFLAKTRNEELRCSTQIADVLMGMEDVTAKINAAVAGKDEAAANDARKKAQTQLEQACEQQAGKKDPRRCETVRLYQGGQYFLYKYKRYSDVRLVFAPEYAIAAFGGDPDNFQFPRWCLDMSVMRAYENGKPVKTPGHLRINWSGPAEKELVFVSGHPGSTDRLLTLAQLQAQREDIPFWLLRAAELRGRYIQFGKTGAENLRIVADPLNGLENSIKVRRQRAGCARRSAARRAEDRGRARAAHEGGQRGALAAHRGRDEARGRSARALHVHRGGRRLQQPAVPLRAHAGARRGRARQAERRPPARIRGHRAAASGAAARRAGAHLSGA